MRLSVIELTDFVDEKPTRFRKLCPVNVSHDVAVEIAGCADPLSTIYPTWSRRVKVVWHRHHELMDEASRTVMEAAPHRVIMVE